MAAKGEEVEVDETFIGGASRFMHKERRVRAITDKKMKGKTAVMGMLERGGKVRACVIGNRRRHELVSTVVPHIKAGSVRQGRGKKKAA